MPRCEVTGIFILEVDVETYQDARTKARRILRDSGIQGIVMEVNKIEEAEHE